jgi:hypothetical protein
MEPSFSDTELAAMQSAPVAEVCQCLSARLSAVQKDDKQGKRNLNSFILHWPPYIRLWHQRRLRKC